MELSESGSTSVTAAALGSDTSLQEEETVGGEEGRVSRREKLGFDGLRAQGQCWSVRESGLTDSHLVISLLSSPTLRLLLLNPSDATSELLRVLLWQLTFQQMNHRVKLSVFYQSNKGFLERHIKASYF